MTRGRPIDPEKSAQQKIRLLDAAKHLLQQKGYAAITVREIAKKAQVNSAMISYYFNNKEGLFLALIDELTAEQGKKMAEIAHADEPLRAFIESILVTLNENAALARFIHSEVLSQKSPLSDAIMQRLPKRMAQFLPQVIRQYQKRGVFRENLNPHYAAFSLMNMIILPFIAEPVREQAWDISKKELESPQWVEHIYQLFYNGCR